MEPTKELFTPGPWRFVTLSVSENHSNRCIVFATEIEKNDSPLATILGGGQNGYYSSKDLVEANATLICAAPELLKALKAMYSRFKHCDNDQIKAEYVKQQAKEAIIKAGGVL